MTNLPKFEDWFQIMVDNGDVALERDGFGLISTWGYPDPTCKTKCSFCHTEIPIGAPRAVRYFNINIYEYLGYYGIACGNCPTLWTVWKNRLLGLFAKKSRQRP